MMNRYAVKLKDSLPNSGRAVIVMAQSEEQAKARAIKSIRRRDGVELTENDIAAVYGGKTA